MRDSLSTLVHPVWFVLLFPVVWLLFTAVFSRVSGWSSLATRFRSGEPSGGETFRFASGFVGKKALPVNYNACLSVTVGNGGFGLSLFWPFRFQSPPLFIPWSHVQSVERQKVFFLMYAVVRVRNQWPVIAIGGEAGERLAEAFATQPSNRGSSSSV